MVEVKAHVVGGPVVLAGSSIQVCVTLTAPPLNPALSSQSSEVCYTVAWGSAEIHCVCTVNSLKVKLPSAATKAAEDSAVTNAATSFAPWKGERGHLVLATKPKILFCDLQLLPGQNKSFLYKEIIPLESPPSYRGKFVKYSYKVTIGTQRLGSPISLFRLPVRVIVLQALSDSCPYSESEELAPTNPFLHTLQKDPSRLSPLQMVQNIVTRKNVNKYNITNARGHVVCFTVYKTSYRLGEDIIATLNFTDSEVPCVQYSVTLQSKEELTERCRQHQNQKAILISYSKIHEFCLSLTQTHFLLPVPLHITPTFSTNLVSLQWQLHFEFVLNVVDDTKGTSSLNIDVDDNPKQWKPPSDLKIETMIWDLPINICPTSPSQVSQALGLSAHQMLQL